MSINKLLIDDQPHQVLPALAKAIGLNEAIFLQQLHYLLNYSKNEFEGKSWIFNSLEQWEEIFCYWSLSTIRRTIKSLSKQGLLLTTDKFNQYKFDKTKWYSINYEQLANLNVSTVKNNKPYVQNEQITSVQIEQITSVQNEQTNNQENNKNTTQEYITPLPPTGESPDGDYTVLQNDDEVKPKKRKPTKPKNDIDYQAVLDFYNEQNELHGKRLPNAIDLNDKRKRGITKILNLLKTPTLDSFKNYIESFFEQATEFYFGGNNRNWRASFDYLLREDTLTKVREEAL